MSEHVDQHHEHGGRVHGHKHFHVTHYLRTGEDWAHLTAVHEHEHNHPQIAHTHKPHEDEAHEHTREAHVHDHARPAESPG
ncbi:MAG TPA: hypothetical protein VEO00_13295 [Actinomycetota bacterium]|nr:hypothetical protein [Actinomycetota bacterium]